MIGQKRQSTVESKVNLPLMLSDRHESEPCKADAMSNVDIMTVRRHTSCQEVGGTDFSKGLLNIS